VTSNEGPVIDYTHIYEHVRRYANEHYGEAGWDMFVECVDMQDFLEEALNNELTTYEAAISHYSRVCTQWDELRKDIQGTVF
jgi:hypothetical protein